MLHLQQPYGVGGGRYYESPLEPGMSVAKRAKNCKAQAARATKSKDTARVSKDRDYYAEASLYHDVTQVLG